MTLTDDEAIAAAAATGEKRDAEASVEHDLAVCLHGTHSGW